VAASADAVNHPPPPSLIKGGELRRHSLASRSRAAARLALSAGTARGPSGSPTF
jgi:hypothetical protein